ncbi:NarK family nitrate/nitrite MFS transporter [Leptolyngbya sp. NIES-2104]|uniref:NarK family nitrate/nitrite MFS transporter n=1 Tax=Leptolyngbya sp. NIES-2104 TaxID=1552121 RepID=UPI0006ECB3A5|nr:NarK family nitrate/nitrite MFS transporter [Leptolyngbya sp. NIES-2104]GAP98243.1 nitrate/nitrite transporter [Leptolyngbya sp. NIES-2104]
MLRGLLSFRGPYRILNFAWFAFFLTFVVWFNYAPFSTVIREDLHLTVAQARTIGLCNLALTIPARIIIGMLLDRFGPRITYSSLLVYAALPCWAFAAAQTFDQLVWSRLAMGVVGAGFVVGIRLVNEWFSSKQIGLAQGIYGGWGNFGSFASEAFLPIVAFGSAFLYSGHENWRFAIALSGLVSLIFGILFYINVRDTPPGKEYQRPARDGGMEVTSRKSFGALILTNIPLFGAMGLIAWRLQLVKFLTPSAMYSVWVCLALLFALQAYQAFRVNREVVLGQKSYPNNDRYEMGQVFVLELAYAVSFGSELAVVSMLPEFFEHTFNLSHHIAGPVAATYPLMNLVARPAGGLISDKIGSRKWTLTAMIAGVGIGYMVMSQIHADLPLPIAILLTMGCAFFVFGGAGATFGIAPLIKRSVTGQIAGNVGAYGSVGSVLYATTYSLLPQTVQGNQLFFQVLGMAGIVVAFLCAFLLREPKATRQEIAEAAMMAH